MKVALFDYELPRHLIAERPAEPRDAARLLDLTGPAPVDRHMRDLPDVLRPDDLMVVNDTRVIPARLRGRRGAAAVEVTLHKDEGGGRWRAFARPAKRLAPGQQVFFADDLAATVAAKGEGGEVTLAFDRSGAGLADAIVRHGIMPLPPYIKRAAEGDPRDRADYQTIFAAREGAVAAPTAGLHFTDRLLAALEERRIERVTLTLHVGAGTFLPVKVEDTLDHRMHAERGTLDAAAADRLNAARAAGRRILAVGTTTLRLLETAVDAAGRFRPFQGDTDIFITPGTPIRSADLLLTNFHLPRSTLLMLVAAFAGRESILAAYEHAKASGYRFYSYGDACLLARAEAA